MKRSLISAAILGILGTGAVFTASAQAVNTQTAEIELCAGEYDIPANTPGLNNPAPIRMWGYALGEASDTACVGQITSPGPSILLPNNTEDTATVYDLQITVRNRLPRATSLIIPGLMKPMSPVMFTAPDGSTRVHSFDTESLPGGQATYSWTGVTQGSYLYQSGTHQQVQVQMGLVGAIMSDAFTGTTATAAYPGLEYSELYPLIYSEIDPVIHAGVAAGEYTTSDMKSTINYAPKYFGITLDTNAGCPEDTFCVQNTRLSTFNGNLGIALDNIPNGSTPLIRLFNGSTRIHTPTLIGANFDVIAEDGHLYPNYRKQYAVALAPLKTKDALLDASGLGAAGGSIRLIDSAMNLSNPAPDATGVVAAQAEGSSVISNNLEDLVEGRFTFKPTATYSAPIFTDGSSPVARRDETRVAEAGSVTIDVLANDTPNGATPEIVGDGPQHGTLVATSTGWTYTHSGDESSRDSFIYKLVNASDEWQPMAGVLIEVDSQNDAPVAADDSVSMKTGQQMEVRVLDNDTDADNPRDLRVTAVDATGFDLGTVEFVDKAITILGGNTAGIGNLVYTVSDGQGGSDTANLAVTVTAGTGAGGDYTGGNTDDSGESVITGQPPVATDDAFSVTEGGAYTVDTAILGVLANDVANGGKVEMDEYPEHGTIEMSAEGLFTYTHNGDEDKEDHFKYTVYNQWGSDTAEVKVTVTAKMDAPRVNPDRARVKAGQSVVIDVLRNDKDRDSDVRKATIEIVAAPSKGTVAIGADNKITYTPNAGASGKDEFKYRLYDDITGEKSRKVAKVKIRIR